MQVYRPLNFIGFVYREIRQGLTDIEAMFKLLDQGPEIEDKPGAKPLAVAGAVVVALTAGEADARCEPVSDPAEVALARRSPAADADEADDAGGGAESGIRCPSGPPLALAAEPLSALPPPLELLDDLRPYICDGGGTGYGVRRDEAEKAEAGAEDKVAVLALAARARADAALISLDALAPADEVEDVEDAF
jgi:ABC-type multidrug transport system fused ATPase/permease subunit